MFPQIFGKYVLEREIAAGGMARVYLATLRGAVGFEKRLVVKQIRPELASDDAFVRRFVEEAKTAVALSHPNIVPVYELGVEQGVYYIAMERCEGLTLAELLSTTGALQPELGAYVGAEVCRALEYAHRRAGIVHRDVTPRNVMVDEEGSVRLIDFGIAAPVTAETDAGRIEVFGSPGHMPPEQLEGGALSPATDVFAVGALLIETWTGNAPFRRSTAKASVAALQEKPAPVDSADPRLEPLRSVIERAVALNAGERPQDASLLSRKLREFIQAHDSDELARRLGEQVRAARDSLSDTRRSSVPPEQQTPRLTGSGTSSRSGSETKTFAVREDMVEWTRPLPASGPESPPKTATRRGWLVILALVAAAAAASVTLGALRERRAAPPLANSSPPLATMATTPSSTPSPAPQPPAVPPADATPTSLASARAPDALRAAENIGRARLRLSADLPATVTIGAQRYANLPRSVELRPGDHTVVFRSHELDEHVQTRVSVSAGQELGLHADFTSASPRIVLR
jgi:serine/threonine-protein kinase